jgi:hypothetical protein
MPSSLVSRTRSTAIEDRDPGLVARERDASRA